MKKNLGGIFATTFITAILVGITGTETCAKDSTTLNIQVEEVFSNNQIQELNQVSDEYLSQLLVQNRYNTANRIVWVYGCADKS